MTQNQIALFKAKEEQFHNRQMERETQRHDIATEQEAVRHAMESEGIDRTKNAITESYNTGVLQHYIRTDSETARSNREQERIKQQSNLETIRHDIISEAVDREKNRISNMANVVRQAELAETTRHSKATENLTQQKQSAEIGKLQAEMASIRSNTSLDSIRFDNIKSQTLKNLEDTKQVGWESLLTQQKIYSENALTNLRNSQTDKTLHEAGLVGVNAWSNAIRGIGGLLSGLKGFPVTAISDGSYPSSVNYNVYTGLYE